MGQALSTTYGTVRVNEGEDRIEPDVERSGYCFTDGAGRISAELLQAVLDRLNIMRQRGNLSLDNTTALQAGTACLCSREALDPNKGPCKNPGILVRRSDGAAPRACCRLTRNSPGGSWCCDRP